MPTKENLYRPPSTRSTCCSSARLHRGPAGRRRGAGRLAAARRRARGRCARHAPGGGPHAGAHRPRAGRAPPAAPPGGARALAATRPRAVIYSTTTAALLWPLPGAIRFDAPAAANRPGRHGLWQRPLERRRLRQAPLLLPSSAGALAEARAAVARLRAERALVLPVPVGTPTLREDATYRGPSPAPRSMRRSTVTHPSATSPPSPTPPTPARRASTACSKPGGAYAGPPSGWS